MIGGGGSRTGNIRTTTDDGTESDLRGLRTKFSRLAEVGKDVIEAMRDRCTGGMAEIKPCPYRTGETVMIKEGPFAGLEAILLELLGRQTCLVLSSEMIARL